MGSEVMHPNPQAARDLTRAISDAAPIRDEQLAGPVLEGLLAENLRAYAGTIEPDPASLTDASLDVRRALAQLPGQDREILQLVAWEQLSVVQAGQVLGLRPAAARQRLHRARGHLRRLLDTEPVRPRQPLPGERPSQAGTTAT
jgi:RNA polymerase sigma factor (sigma-70 family)